MGEHDLDPRALLWAVFWLVAVVVLFAGALRLPLETRHGRWATRAYAAVVVLVAAGATVLANVALTLHDAHLDLTREKVYTPSAAAMRVADDLDRAVTVTWF